MFKYLLLLSCLYSCASPSAEWSPWKINTQPQVKQTWHWCNAQMDGPTLHRKGMCWQAQECRTKDPWYASAKKECRPLPLFCKHGDLDCMDLNAIFNKVITNPENLK